MGVATVTSFLLPGKKKGLKGKGEVTYGYGVGSRPSTLRLGVLPNNSQLLEAGDIGSTPATSGTSIKEAWPSAA